MNFSDRVKAIRKEGKMNQEKFAESLGLSRDQFANFEYDRISESSKNPIIKAICEKYNINEIWLRSGEGEMHDPMDRNQELASLTRKLMKDEDPAYREELIKIIADMDLDTLKIWYDYAKQWVTNVENRK